jgi:hypothetical protein
MNARIALVLTTVLFASQVAHADKDKRYTVADLKQLVNGKSFQEALEHLDDISPADRTADWDDLGGRAAVGAIDHQREPLAKLQLMLAIEEKYPKIIKHATYNSLRTEVGPKGFAACFDASNEVSECKAFAEKFVDDDAANGKLALAMAKVARRGMFAYGAIPLFTRAIAATKGTAICKDEDLKLSVVASLGLPTDDAAQTQGRTIAGTCWTDLHAPIVDAFKAEPSGYLKTNACALLKARKALTSELSGLCAE